MFPQTLESITLRKTEVLREIRESHKEMKRLSRGILAPVAPAASQASSLARRINLGMAALDGFMFGVRIMRRLRTLFKK